jgi:hypothetical protein
LLLGADGRLPKVRRGRVCCETRHHHDKTPVFFRRSENTGIAVFVCSSAAMKPHRGWYPALLREHEHKAEESRFLFVLRLLFVFYRPKLPQVAKRKSTLESF